MTSRLVIVCAIAALADLAVLRAQDGVAIGLDDGSPVREIARHTGGGWVSAASCVPQSSGSSGRERIVVSGGPPSRGVQALVPGGAEWVRLSPFILQLFDRREREQRLTRERTSVAPRAVDWIYAADTSGDRIYYFEASRRVAQLEENADADTDPPGTLRIAVAGFLRDGRDGPIGLGTKSELRWEEDGLPARPTRPDLLPLGVIAQSEGSLWVMKGQSGSSAWFTLYDVSGRGVRTALTIRGARC